MRALGFEPKKEEIQKMISDVDAPWLACGFFRSLVMVYRRLKAISEA